MSARDMIEAAGERHHQGESERFQRACEAAALYIHHQKLSDMDTGGLHKVRSQVQLILGAADMMDPLRRKDASSDHRLVEQDARMIVGDVLRCARRVRGVKVQFSVFRHPRFKTDPKDLIWSEIPGVEDYSVRRFMEAARLMVPRSTETEDDGMPGGLVTGLYTPEASDSIYRVESRPSYIHFELVKG